MVTGMNTRHQAVAARSRSGSSPGSGSGARRQANGQSKPATGQLSELGLQLYELSTSEWGENKALEMVGQDPSFLDLQTKIRKIAPFNEPVLVTGESGSGKELVSQAIYLLGPRCGKPFVSVNCPQYQEGNLTVSELFGHKKGSFTGAVADRKGCFETADGGLVFLDEVGDLQMSAQVMLLRALASGEFQPLGADYKRTVNVRLVAATNRPLDRLMVGQEFRNDLYFRLRYFLLEIPPLRQRGDDWQLLLEYFLDKLHKKYSVRKHFSRPSLKVLKEYHWPGNIRELSSIATMGYAMCDGDTIEPHDFTAHLAPRAESEHAERDLYQQLVLGGDDFWDAIHGPFMQRDLNRAQVRRVIEKGLTEARGSYRQLLDIFRIAASDYQKFMDFLRHHRLKP